MIFRTGLLLTFSQDLRTLYDRTDLRHHLFYNFPCHSGGGPMAVLYEWLRDHCKGKWSIGIESVNNAPFKKTEKVLFQLEADDFFV